MARIEISLNEYETLKENIKKLEETNVQLEKAINEISNSNKELFDELQEIVNATAFVDRVFKWKKTIQNAKKILKKYE